MLLQYFDFQSPFFLSDDSWSFRMFRYTSSFEIWLIVGKLIWTIKILYIVLKNCIINGRCKKILILAYKYVIVLMYCMSHVILSSIASRFSQNETAAQSTEKYCDFVPGEKEPLMQSADHDTHFSKKIFMGKQGDWQFTGLLKTPKHSNSWLKDIKKHFEQFTEMQEVISLTIDYYENFPDKLGWVVNIFCWCLC